MDEAAIHQDVEALQAKLPPSAVLVAAIGPEDAEGGAFFWAEWFQTLEPLPMEDKIAVLAMLSNKWLELCEQVAQMHGVADASVIALVRKYQDQFKNEGPPKSN